MENDFHNSSPRIGERGIRILAILGFVAVVGVGLWGSVAIARAVPNAFSSLAAAFVSLTSIFVPAGETVSLSAPATVQSGAPFTLSWTHDKQSVDGSYTFRYDCADGVYFTATGASGSTDTIYCNVPYNFLNAGDSLTVTPVSTKNPSIPVTVYMDFVPNGATKATVTGKAVLTIVGNGTSGSSPATPTTPVTTPTAPTVTPGQSTTHTYPVSGAPASNPNGYVDLTARVIEVGVVDKNSGAFFASSTPSRAVTGADGQYRIAVRFAIENNGTKTSPQFDFNAVLPTYPQYIFSSPMQQALAPGDRIEFTLGYDQPDQGGNGVFTVNVDPSSRINEPNKTNNIIHYTVTTNP
jgi:hypothetical protein